MLLKHDFVHQEAKNRHNENGWVFSKESNDQDATLSTLAVCLFNEIDGVIQKFELLPLECELELSCVIYVYTEIPELYLSLDIVKILANIDCNIDFDIYYLCEKEDAGE